MTVQLVNEDILKVQVYTSQGNQQAINRFMFRCNNRVGTITDQTVVDLMSPFFAAFYKTWMGPLQIFRGIRLQVVRPIPSDYVTSVIDAGNGDLAGPALPSQVALCVQFRTGVTGKFNRGRTYLPFWDSTLNSGGEATPTAGAFALVDPFMIALLSNQTWADGIGNHILTQLIIDSQGRTTPPVVAPHITPVVGYKIDRQWATQRRRSRINRPDQMGP